MIDVTLEKLCKTGDVVGAATLLRAIRLANAAPETVPPSAPAGPQTQQPEPEPEPQAKPHPVDANGECSGAPAQMVMRTLRKRQPRGAGRWRCVRGGGHIGKHRWRWESAEPAPPPVPLRLIEVEAVGQ